MWRKKRVQWSLLRRWKKNYGKIGCWVITAYKFLLMQFYILNRIGFALRSGEEHCCLRLPSQISVVNTEDTPPRMHTSCIVKDISKTCQGGLKSQKWPINMLYIHHMHVNMQRPSRCFSEVISEVECTVSQWASKWCIIFESLEESYRRLLV